MKKLAPICLMFALSACVSNKFVASNKIDNNLNLKNSTIHAYSMLDIRESEFGEKMLSSLNANISEKFKSRGIESTVNVFKESKTAQLFSISNSGVLPVEEFVKEKTNEENISNVKYRLIILPSQMTVSGSWRFFKITWILQDAKTSKMVWKGISQGEHLVQFSVNESPDSRAEIISKSLFAQLDAANVF